MFRTKEKGFKTKTRTINLNNNGFKSIAFFTLSLLFGLMTLIFLVVKSDLGVYMYVVLAVSVIIFAVNLGWSYKNVYIPYTRFEEALKAFNMGNVHNSLRDIDVCYSEEMRKTIYDLFGVVDNMNAIKMTNMHAEYRALQNQINPHFLYNTLEAIRSDAICNGVGSIADISEALATFFRYTISNINSMVPLEEELNNSETYFMIQKFRFGDKINLRIELDEEDTFFLDYRIPKLTLQPIIENAIVHGLERKLGIGTVCIEITALDNRIIMRIADDGIGIDEAVLSRISEQLNEMPVKNLIPGISDGEGIGLINVNKRLKLLFGEEYGLRINSIKNFGTNVYVTLPLVKK